MKPKKNQLLIAIIFLIITLTVGCSSNEGTEAQAERALPVEVQTVELGSVQIKDLITGNLTPGAEVPVMPKIGGKIEQVAVSVGQKVQQGELLFQLETTDIEAQLRQAEAALEAAQTSYTNAETQIPHNLKMAEVNYNTAKSAYERLERLYNEGGISKQELEGALAQLEVAEAQYANAKNAPLQLETVKAQVKQAKAAYDAVKTQLGYASIRAPISGAVTSLYYDLGHTIGPGMPVAMVAQLDPIFGVFNLTESQVNKLKIGDEVEIQVKAASSSPFLGKVAEVAPSADPQTRSYKVKVELPNPDEVLKGGMTAQVGFVLEGLEDTLVVPLESVVTKGNQQIIYLVDGNKARECPVEVLLQDNHNVAIAGDVQVGEQVVIVGQAFLQDGSPVEVVSEGVK